MADDLEGLKAELAALKKQLEDSRTPKKKKKEEEEEEEEPPRKKHDKSMEIEGLSESTGHAILEKIKALEERLSKTALRWFP